MKNVEIYSEFEANEQRIEVKLRFINDEVFGKISEGYQMITEDKIEFETKEVNSKKKTITFILENYMQILKSIHTKIYLTKDGKKRTKLRELQFKDAEFGSLVRKIEVMENYVGLRSTVTKNDLVVSIVPVYEGGEPEKIEYFEKHKNDDHDKKYILFFEKRSETYGESSYQVFSKYIEKNSNVRFVLSTLNPDYDKLVKKYGKFIVKKGSIEFYDVLFQAQLLVSSELPANLITGKCIDMNIIEYINKIPFIFLQHGIFFAKPITSPSMKMFWKKNIRYNLIKTVVSSKLEMEELYKVGYTPEDLILTGLATLDNVDKTQEKKYCAYMPTYRNWEDLMVYSGRIKETTYYEDIVTVIQIFKKIKKINDLVVVPHPSYEGHIDYENLFPGVRFANYTSVRDQLRLYITDFSSAGFDAQFRGAAIMYYWNRRDDIEKNYKVTSPINKSNCNGIPVVSKQELREELVKLYKNDFILDEYYTNNFKDRMEFSDYKNTDRIIDYIEEFLNDSKKNTIRVQKIGEDINYFFRNTNPTENKLRNYYEQKEKFDDLKIEKLIKVTDENSLLKFHFSENLYYSDLYLVMTNLETNEKHTYKLGYQRGNFLVKKQDFDFLEGYFTMDLYMVPQFGTIKRFKIKCELDYRDKQQKIKFKKFHSVPRAAPEIKIYLFNKSLKTAAIELYTHDNKTKKIELSALKKTNIAIDYREYSHFTISGNIKVLNKKEVFQKMRR